MELHQVEAIGGKVLETVLHKAGEILLVVAGGGMRRQAAAGLGGDHDLILALALQLRDQALAPPHAVDIGGVDEVDAAIDGLMESGERFGIVNGSPGAADGPRAKTDFGNLPGGTA